MHRSNGPASLADLSAAGVRLRPYEAVTLVRELTLQVSRGQIPGVPSPQVVRLSATGTVSVEGPVAAGGPAVVRAAQLLESLLPPPDSGSQFRVPGALRLVVARGLGTVDLPAFPSLDGFIDALTRFAATDPPAMVSALVHAWAESTAAQTVVTQRDESRGATAPAHVEPFSPPRPVDLRSSALPAGLTISDIRRARRATGMPLTQVSNRCDIPVPLLRQLEWGYLINWPSGQTGRSQLIKYARATGLDEHLVVSTIAPLLDQVDRAALLVLRADAPTLAAVSRPVPPDLADAVIVKVEDVSVSPASRLLVGSAPAARETRRRGIALAALGIPALLALGLLPVWWAAKNETSDRVGPGIQQAAETRPAGPAREPEPNADARTEPAAPATGAPAPVPDRTTRPDTLVPAANPGPDPAYRPALDDGEAAEAFESIGTPRFEDEGAEGSPTLVRTSAANTSTLRITSIVDDSARNFHVRPSPDGSRIAFDSDRGGERAVYVADADGRNVRRVSPEGYAAVPSWSPDGSRLLFSLAEPDREVWNLWTLVLDTGAAKQVTHLRSGQPWGGSWFPDGRRVAYSRGTEFVIHDLATGAEKVFESPRKGRAVRSPAVSPDGRRVMFHVAREGGWLLELPEGSMRRVLEDPTAREYTWSPDGRRVAYYSGRSGTWGVWVMAAR